jgi:hypothetical protein
MVSLVLLISCEGDTGPQGPQGPQGPGTRIVKSGIVSSAASTSGQNISVPELDLADFPVVAVYVSDEFGDWVQMNMVLFDPNTSTYPLFEVAVLRTGSVTIFSTFVGEAYRIVIVY